MELQETLKLVGMNPTEAQIYLYLLKTGQCTKQVISTELGIVRQTIYEVVNKMLAKGYISYTETNTRKMYHATPPKFLLDMLKEKEASFTANLPLLEALTNQSQPVHVQTYTGIEGFKHLISMTLDSTEELLWMASKEIHKKLFDAYYHDNYSLKRVEKKIPLKLLAPKNHHNWKSSKQSFREVRTLEKPIYQSSFIVFEDKVMLLSFNTENLHGVLIQSSEISSMMRELFNTAWKNSKKV